MAVSCKNGEWDVNMQQSPVATSSQMRKGDVVQEYPAQAIDTFLIDNTVTRAFVMISSTTQAPSSTIVAPDGTEHTVPSADSLIKKFSTPGGEMVQWTLVNPVAGAWVLRLNSPKAGDEVEIMANRLPRAFELNLTSTARAFVATWDIAGSSNTGDVRFFLDTDGKGLDGAYIGKIHDQAGSFTYTIPAELTECKYFVYAIRSAPGETDATDYASDAVLTGNSIVPVPTDVSATSNQSGNMVVSWRVPPGSTVSGFMIYSVNADDSETLVATASTDERRVSFNLANHISKRIAVRAFDELGRRSCLTDAEDIITGVSEPEPGTRNEERGTTWNLEHGTWNVTVIPNPTTGATIIRYSGDGELVGDAVVLNNLGSTVAQISTLQNEVLWDASVVSSGTYFVRLRTTNGDVAVMISVIR